LGNNLNKINFTSGCSNNTNKLILNDVPYEDVSCFQYRSSLVTNNGDIGVKIKEITSSVNLTEEFMIT